MLNKNSVLVGLLIGSILPAISWGVFEYVLHGNFELMNKPAAPYLIAIILNLGMVRYSFKNNLEKAGGGMMMVTFAFMLLVFLLKIQPR